MSGPAAVTVTLNPVIDQTLSIPERNREGPQAVAVRAGSCSERP
jgi:fructose-1-phosphate kinase PfkB-like protein